MFCECAPSVSIWKVQFTKNNIIFGFKRKWNNTVNVIALIEKQIIYRHSIRRNDKGHILRRTKEKYLNTTEQLKPLLFQIVTGHSTLHLVISPYSI